MLYGAPLSAYVTDGGIDPMLAVQLLMPALSGVAAAHAAGLLHRDLKPDNLFVVHRSGAVPHTTKVLDFGLAKTVAAPADRRLTVNGALVGTPLYMAPEQLTDPSTDPRADVFSLGLILFELLTGRSPYRSRDVNPLILEVATMTYPSPAELRPELPPALSDAVSQAMAREPSERYASVAELARALEPFGGGVSFERPNTTQYTTWNLPRAPAPPSPSPSLVAQTAESVHIPPRGAPWLVLGIGIASGVVLLSGSLLLAALAGGSDDEPAIVSPEATSEPASSPTVEEPEAPSFPNSEVPAIDFVPTPPEAPPAPPPPGRVRRSLRRSTTHDASQRRGDDSSPRGLGDTPVNPFAP